jgi:hypothetical protein
LAAVGAVGLALGIGAATTYRAIASRHVASARPATSPGLAVPVASPASTQLPLLDAPGVSPPASTSARESAAPTPAPQQGHAAPAGKASRPGSRTPAATPAGKPVTGKPNCNPNFYLDEQGEKHFKPECFLQ